MFTCSQRNPTRIENKSKTESCPRATETDSHARATETDSCPQATETDSPTQTTETDSCARATETNSCTRATETDSCARATETDSCLRAMRMNSYPRAMRENSWRQQPRELRPKHKKNDTHPRDNSKQTKIRQKGDVNREQHRSSDKSHGTTGRQRRKPRTSAKTTDQATTPTVELHKTKEDTIKEFVQQHGTINLDWYVPDLCNTRVGDLIEKRLQLGTTEGRILFSSPALNEFFKHPTSS